MTRSFIFHVISIYESQENTWSSRKEFVGKIRVNNEQMDELIMTPHLGLSWSPGRGYYEMTFAKRHIKKVMSFGNSKNPVQASLECWGAQA